jgi:hypothetical protein
MKDGHSRDTGNTDHKTQDEDKQNKQKTTQHRKLKRLFQKRIVRAKLDNYIIILTFQNICIG